MHKKQKRFIQWLLTPACEKHPETLKKLSAELNCRPSTLIGWFNQPEFILMLQGIIRYQVLLQIANADQALFQTAMERDIRSIQARVNIQDPNPPSTNTDTCTKKDLLVFTPEEIQQARKNIKEWEEREFCISQQNESD